MFKCSQVRLLLRPLGEWQAFWGRYLQRSQLCFFFSSGHLLAVCYLPYMYIIYYAQTLSGQFCILVRQIKMLHVAVQCVWFIASSP